MLHVPRGFQKILEFYNYLEQDAVIIIIMYIHFIRDKDLVGPLWNDKTYMYFYYSVIFTDLPYHKLDLDDGSSFAPLFSTGFILPV